MTGGRFAGLSLAAAVMLALGLGTAVTAPDTNVPWSLLGSGAGGKASSTNFSGGFSAGQTAIGQVESTDSPGFRLSAGYWYGARDADGDGLAHAADNCPALANPDQTNTDATLATGGASVSGDGAGDACDSDDDNDGWSDGAEGTIGTNPLDNCVTGPGSGGDAWPADINGDGFSDISDITFLTNDFGDAVPGDAPARHDIAPDPPDAFVDITDISRMTGLFGQGCT